MIFPSLLEVLEFFGKEPNSARGPLCDNAFHSGVATFRPPSFQRIDDGVFVYSAFCFRGPEAGKGRDSIDSFDPKIAPKKQGLQQL